MVSQQETKTTPHRAQRAKWNAQYDRFQRNLVNTKHLMKADLVAMVLAGGSGVLSSEFFTRPIQEIPLTFATLVVAAATGLATEGINLLAESQLKQHLKSGRRLKS